MKRRVRDIVLVVVLCLSFFSYGYAEPNVDIVGETAILMDSKTGRILFEKNSHLQMYPASTTKIMTAILAIEHCDLNQIITIDAEIPFSELSDGSKTYLLEGEQLTVEQLLYALLLESANDAAIALAKHVSGSIEEFAQLMNKKAIEVGALNTNFVNPNGLPDEEHVTTAHDLAVIARYAMQNEKFREIVKTVRYTIPPTNIQEERYYKIGNKLLWDTKKALYYNGEYISPKYEYTTGVKTGYTLAAGSCLVSSAKKDREVIAVVLKSDPNNVFLDSIKLLEKGLNEYKNILIISQGEKIGSVKIKNGVQNSIDAIVNDEIIKTVPVHYHMTEFEKEIVLKDRLIAPVNKGDELGKIVIKHNGEVVDEIPVTALETVEVSLVAGLTTQLLKGLGHIKYIIWGCITFVLAYGILVIKIRVTRRKKRRMRRNRYHMDNNYIRRNILK